MDEKRALARFFRFKRLAALVIHIERFWLHCWPAVMVIGLFLALSLFNIWQALPLPLHISGLILLAVAFAFAVVHAVRNLRAAPPASGLSRLERDSAIEPHGLDALDDTLSSGDTDPLTAALWQRTRARAAGLSQSLRLGLPRSPLPARDPWAVRAAMLLILVVGLVEADGRISERLASSAYFGRASAETVTAAPSARLWLTPPVYTRQAPRQIEPNGQTVQVPIGSAAMIQVQDLSANAAHAQAPLEIRSGGQALALQSLGPGAVEARATLDDSGAIEVRINDRVVAQWPVQLIPDLPPSVRIAGQPGQTSRGVLKIDLEAGDDYGVREIHLVITSDLIDVPRRISIAKPRAGSTEVDGARYLDLTADRLAGQPVEINLEAEDAIGQTGQSPVIKITLPERPFTHPLAQAVIAARKQLVAQPHAAYQVSTVIKGLRDHPLTAQFDTTVPFALGMAASRLLIERTPEGLNSVVDLLWEIALHIEDGALSLAEQRLRDLQDRIAEALENGAEMSELEAMLRELQHEMDRFLDELTRQAMEQQRLNDPNAEPQPLPPNAELVDRQDLQSMLDQIRELIEQGDRERAMEMMAQLRDMLENMQTATNQSMEPSPGEQALSDLQKMIQMQQNLLDRTHDAQQQQGQIDRSQQQGDDVREGPQGMSDLAMEQNALRQALGELMRRLGEAGMPLPRPLGDAELQMRQARDSLSAAQAGQAMGPQSNAVDLMNQGGQALLEQLREQLANQQGQGTGMQRPQAQRQGRDPLGRARRNDGGSSSYGTELPADTDLGRARGVLEELQRRSGERDRPPRELDYINRLLDRF